MPVNQEIIGNFWVEGQPLIQAVIISPKDRSEIQDCIKSKMFC